MTVAAEQAIVALQFQPLTYGDLLDARVRNVAVPDQVLAQHLDASGSKSRIGARCAHHLPHNTVRGAICSPVIPNVARRTSRSRWRSRRGNSSSVARGAIGGMCAPVSYADRTPTSPRAPSTMRQRLSHQTR